jgi:hypothetical protein
MSQNTDAQNRTAARPKSSDVDPPGRRLFDAAIAIYLMTLAAFVALAALGIHTEASKHGAAVLLIVASVIPGGTFALFYFVFFASSLAGVPLIRFSNGLSVIQRNWRGLVGTVLLLAVFCAILAMAA